jgi:DnaD/phage-associated family protein
MGRYTWIKLYTEILSDPKMGRLDDRLWRRAIELFMLAGSTGTTGQLPQMEEMEWILRVKKSNLLDDFNALAKNGIVHETQHGSWVVTNFAKRQAAMSATERTQKRRAGETDAKRNRNEKVTEEEGEVEEEKEGEAEKKTPAAAADNPYATYEANIGVLTSAVSEKIKLAEADNPPGWVSEAICIAALRNKLRWDYVEGILRRWQTQGKDSGGKALVAQDAIPVETELMRRERLGIGVERAMVHA